MFKYKADILPVTLILCLSFLDFFLYFTVDNTLLLCVYFLLMIVPKGVICAWNHHHQHTMTFHSVALNRLLEFFYALHTGVTTNLWVLHHVLGHHHNYLDQNKDESGWKRADGTVMGVVEYTVLIAATAYYRGFQVGKRYPKVQKAFIVFGVLTLLAVIALVAYKPVPALLLFVLPMIVSLLFTCWVTYDHHAGLDTEDPFQASYNITSRWFNIMTGNLGYHTAHHIKQGLHWSKLPAYHETIKEQIPQAFYRKSTFDLV
ncbi:MAG: fatty acid desaturase [Pseudomonadales bacterium]|nr:fatty acid desaturase [Pseudomonadales bacterium]